MLVDACLAQRVQTIGFLSLTFQLPVLKLSWMSIAQQVLAPHDDGQMETQPPVGNPCRRAIHAGMDDARCNDRMSIV